MKRFFRASGLAFSLMGVWPSVGAASEDAVKMKLGREVFTSLASPQCGICHTLQDAGTSGQIGAKLEELKPDAAKVAEAVRKGLGVMPAYAGILNAEQIEAVAYYVARAAAKAK